MSGETYILIVDDRPENLLALESILAKDRTLTVMQARSGNEALKLMLAYDFALILLDVQMPELDGFETAGLMKNNRQTKDIPIIFVTAISKEKEYVFKGYQTGAVDYLFKPIDPDLLLAKVNVFLELYKQRKHAERLAAELQEVNNKLSLVNAKLQMEVARKDLTESRIQNKPHNRHPVFDQMNADNPEGKT